MQNAYIFIQDNAFEYVVCEKATILYRPQCVKRRSVTSPAYLAVVADVGRGAPGGC